jgi:2,3-bisphosphoglycerate-dependent phosphoglycerate mutase
MKIYFSRHGESQANILHEISNRGLRHPLTAAGRRQAAALAEALRPQAITRVYSSPVLRAIETSIIVAHQLGVDYEVTGALREYDMGELEGRTDDQAWQIWRELFDAWLSDQRYDQRAPGGESFLEVRDRFMPFIDRLIRQHKQSDANLLCVGHGGLYWMMLPLVLANVDVDFIREQGGFNYTGVIVAEVKPDGLVCMEWNGQVFGR